MSVFHLPFQRTIRVLDKSLLLLTLACTMFSARSSFADTFGHGDKSFEIEFVTIGNPGNVPDLDNNPRSYIGHPGVVPIGGVDYEFRMGKYEISREQVDKANALGNLGITMLDMSKVVLNLTEATANEPTLPATGINWYEAATFVNWLNVSEGHPAAYKVTDGAFQVWGPSDAGYDASNIFRNREAYYFLPSDDEWYKAAFYDPKKDVYYHYATGSDTPPDRVATGTAEGSVVYHQRRPALVTQAGGLSPYGTMGQSGNAWEWEETQYKHVNQKITGLRGLRGGDWGTDAEHVSADYRNPFGPEVENQLMSFGFRVASIAQPHLLGDVNSNGIVDAADIDRILPQATDLTLDLNGDKVVNHEDRAFWVHEVANTWFGDVNLDGLFTSSDLLIVFQQGVYEDTIVQNASWESGDWNGDREFTSADLVMALQDGGYEQGRRSRTLAVPEPAGSSLLLLISVAGATLSSSRRQAAS